MSTQSVDSYAMRGKVFIGSELIEALFHPLKIVKISCCVALSKVYVALVVLSRAESCNWLIDAVLTIALF